MFDKGFTLSKRSLGICLILVGAAAFAAILAVDIVDAGREGGIGPAQQIALAAAALTALVGITLLPLGNQPA